MSGGARSGAWALVALALVAGGIAAWAGSRSAPEDDSGGEAGTAEARAREAVERFFDRYHDPDGRIVRLDQGSSTVAEGQAYAMLLAAAIGDRERFDSVWGWARNNLQRDDGLLSTLWEGGEVTDPQPAADADLDAARALIVAARRFGDEGYRREGVRLGEAILAHETVAPEGDPVLVAGPWARAGQPTVNPSYLDPRAFAELGQASGDPRWRGLAESSRALTAELTAEPAALPPDWARLESGTAVPAAAPNGDGPAYGFDAVRVPIRLAASCDTRDRELAASTWRQLAPAMANGHGAVLTLAGRPTGAAPHPAALVGAAAAARAAGDIAASDDLFARAEQEDARTPTYFGAAWIALGRVMLTTDLLGGCDAKAEGSPA